MLKTQRIVPSGPAWCGLAYLAARPQSDRVETVLLSTFQSSLTTDFLFCLHLVQQQVSSVLHSDVHSLTASMKAFFENLIAGFWNRLHPRCAGAWSSNSGCSLGFYLSDDEVTKHKFVLSDRRRTQHLSILGKTGAGKSFLLRHICRQDIEAGRGFIFFDLHGDATPFLLAAIAAKEKALGYDLSHRVVVIDPSDLDFSVGLNILEEDFPSFVRIAEVVQVLLHHWNLEQFGARTDELLRNSLFTLAANKLTLLELLLFLTNSTFRAACLRQLQNVEIKDYFQGRYDRLTEPMRRVMAEPLLNKIGAFVSDPSFKHLVAQQNSTFSIRDAMDEQRWVIVNVPKGRLGQNALTLASLFLTLIKNALFTRRRRELYSIFIDEAQNLLLFDSGLEVMLSEARKFGVSIVLANQYLDQYPPEMRAAIFSLGSFAFFLLSSQDAQHVATALDGGKPLAETLKNLPERHLVVKSGHDRPREVVVPDVKLPASNFADLYMRSRTRWARSREAIDRQIAARRKAFNVTSDEALDDWE